MTFDPTCSCNEGDSVPAAAFTDPYTVTMAGFSELAGQEDRDKHTFESMDEK